jgi:ribosomal-protein-alanine N-acetyltransferase
MIAFPWSARTWTDDVTAADLDEMADVHAEAFSRTWSADDFAALLTGEGVFAIALRRRSPFGARSLVGFVLVRAAADEAEILTIAVRGGARRRGHGRRLMDEALRRLYRDRVAACFLEVDRGNAAAVSLYRALGFAVVAERPRYYAAPPSGGAGAGAALVMRLQLR